MNLEKFSLLNYSVPIADVTIVISYLVMFCIFSILVYLIIFKNKHKK